MVGFLELARQLYLGIPEIEGSTPLPELELLKYYPKGTSVNASEIRKLFLNNPGPNIILFQLGSNESKRIFGGYASQSWSHPGPHFGTDSCFLFLMIKNGDKIKLRVNPNPPTGKKRILWHNSNNSLSFGTTDLVLGEDVNFDKSGKMEI